MSKSTVSVFVVAAVALIATVCSKTYGDHQSGTKGMAKYWSQATPDVRKAHETAKAILEESGKKHQLTDGQIATLDKYVDSPVMLLRLEVLIALGNADPKHAQAASAVARKGFASKDAMTRLYALSTLDRLNAPDIVPVAKSMLSDPSHYVTPEAHKILKRRGAG